jgi:glutamate N-acetyltransferase/amino-acid N-acetyltransferase
MIENIMLKDIKGFNVTGLKVGIKASGKHDLGIIVADDICPLAGVYTTSSVCAAPVKVCRKHIKASGWSGRAIVVNSGNANACTGSPGLLNARDMTKVLARFAGCDYHNVMVCSTGIIGEQLPREIVLSGIKKGYQNIVDGVGAEDFSRAIMTTDTINKELGTSVAIGGKKVKIAGAAKGVGMLAPNMATMLAFLLSDVSIRPGALQHILEDVVDYTFNCVTVDGDTSTNDSCMLMASGKAGNKKITNPDSKDGRIFRDALKEVSYELSRMIAKDGEGATTMIRVLVSGAFTRDDAKAVARSVAESPLVKTAVAGNDPNWGRIMMAIGKAKVGANQNRIKVKLGGIELFADGTPLEFDEAEVSEKMKAEELDIEIDLGRKPDFRAEMLTCDLTHGYIEVNADYHT